MKRCSRINHNGTRCRRYTRTKYCWQHKRKQKGGANSNLKCKSHGESKVKCWSNNSQLNEYNDYYCPQGGQMVNYHNYHLYRCQSNNHQCQHDSNLNSAQHICQKNVYPQVSNFPVNLCSSVEQSGQYSNGYTFYKVFIMLNVNVFNYDWRSGKFDQFKQYLLPSSYVDYVNPQKSKTEHLTLLSFRIPSQGVSFSDLQTELRQIKNSLYQYLKQQNNASKIDLFANHLKTIGQQGYVAIVFDQSKWYNDLVRTTENYLALLYGNNICHMYDGLIKPHISIGQIDPNKTDIRLRIELDSTHNLKIPKNYISNNLTKDDLFKISVCRQKLEFDQTLNQQKFPIRCIQGSMKNL